MLIRDSDTYADADVAGACETYKHLAYSPLLKKGVRVIVKMAGSARWRIWSVRGIKSSDFVSPSLESCFTYSLRCVDLYKWLGWKPDMAKFGTGKSARVFFLAKCSGGVLKVLSARDSISRRSVTLLSVFVRALSGAHEFCFALRISAVFMSTKVSEYFDFTSKALVEGAGFALEKAIARFLFITYSDGRAVYSSLYRQAVRHSNGASCG